MDKEYELQRKDIVENNNEMHIVAGCCPSGMFCLVNIHNKAISLSKGSELNLLFKAEDLEDLLPI